MNNERAVSGSDLAWEIGQRLELFYENTENEVVILTFMKSSKIMFHRNRIRDLGKILEDILEYKH